MRSIDLYTAVRAVDDNILERSENAAYRQKKNGWLKWGAMVAAFPCRIDCRHHSVIGTLRFCCV